MDTTGFHYNGQRKKIRDGAALSPFTHNATVSALSFHKSFAEYAETPLVNLKGLAGRLGVGHVLVKDESKRFGLNAFKVLGGSYAIGRILAERLNRPLEELGRKELCSASVRDRLGDIAFVTATDGNHGRGIAWTARQLGQRAIVFMPKGSAEIRAENIRATGAQCTITDMNYDDAVRHAEAFAREHNGILVQDTAWDGYEDIPLWIMQGYMTLASEALGQMRAFGRDRPTHLFLQAGVGSFAAAVLGFMLAELGENSPRTVIVEPDKADCIFRSMRAGDGAAHAVTGDMRTIMAGLACGEPSRIGWAILRDYAEATMSCPDYIAANGMRILAAPWSGDTPVVSGESGAVPVGALQHIMTHEEWSPIRRRLGLDQDSCVLCISTEGDTSPELYEEIVWRGYCPDRSRQRACGM